MMDNCVIERGGKVRGSEIEELRSAVGWDRMERRLEKVLKGLYTYYCIKSDGRLIGFLSVISDGVADALLADLMVHPDFQGKGLGAKLVRRAIADLTSEGIRAIQVIFVHALADFYRKLGFHIVSAGMIDNETKGLRFHTEI